MRVPSRLNARLTARASVWLTGVVAALVTAVYCVARRWRVGDGFGAFVVAGRPWTDPSSTPTDILVKSHVGFDGQFFYRLAHAPWRVEMGRVYGVQFDYAARSGRVGYPFLAWLASFGGRPSLVAGALVVVNVLAVGALAAVGAALARGRGRSEWWGLALAFYWGFAVVVGRDIAEVVAALGVFAMLLAVDRGRYRWAAVAATCAVMTREQAVLSVAAVAIGLVWHSARVEGWRVAITRSATIAAPAAAVFLAWQLWVASITGDLPVTASSSPNSTVPFGELPHSIGVWAGDAVDALTGRVRWGAVLPFLLVVGFVVMVSAVFASGALARAWSTRPWEVLVGVAALVVLVSSSHAVLETPTEFRQSSEVVGVSWLVLWQADGAASRYRRWALAVFVPLTLLAFVWRVRIR